MLSVDALQERTPPGPLPEFLRAKKVFPDRDQMLIGDLVLISPHKSAPHQLAIQAFQQKSYDFDHAQWTHAAVYVGEGFVCESTAKGVIVSELLNVFQNHSVRFRRFDCDDPKFRFRIAIGALRRITKPYRWHAVWNLIKKVAPFSGSGSKADTKKAWRSKKEKASICSELYCEAFLFSTERSPLSEEVAIPTPADLSNTSRLVDVDLRWLRIPASK